MHFWGAKLNQKARKRQKVKAAVLQPGCLEALLQRVSGQTSKTPARLKGASRGSSRWCRLFNMLISFIFFLSLLIVSHSHCIRSSSEVSLCQHRSSRSVKGKGRKNPSFTHCSILSMEEQHYDALMHLSQQFWFWAQVLTKSQQHKPQPLQCHHSPCRARGPAQDHQAGSKRVLASSG